MQVGSQREGDADDNGNTKYICPPWATAMMAIILIICIGYVVVASMLIHGARKVTGDKYFV